MPTKPELCRLQNHHTAMTTIVPATPGHSGLLADIGSRSLLESHGHSAPAAVMQAYLAEKFTGQALAEELSDPQNVFHVVYADGEPAGYSKIIYRQPLAQLPQKRITKLERLYLLQRFYDRKLGQELLAFNIRLSQAQGEEGMWLYVWKENERALRFYTKAGFQLVGDGFFRLTDEHANPNWQLFLPYEKRQP